MTAFEYLRRLHEVCQFQTREKSKVGVASNSELRRWIANGALVVNGYKAELTDVFDYPIMSVHLFPNRKVTIL